jgi:GPH family glycoside/pentoside/hexuronide:cation symporter
MVEITPEATVPVKRRTSAVSKYSYAIGAVAFGLKGVALAQLMLFYNQVLGLPASWVSVVIGIALIVDAIVDPLIGQVSDTWRSRWGRRHPFMYASAIPAIFFGLLPISLRMLGLLPPNGSPLIVVLLAVDTTVAVALAVIAIIVGTSMMADIVEQVQAKTGQRSEGLIFSADTMVKQIVTGVGSMGIAVRDLVRRRGWLPR